MTDTTQNRSITWKLSRRLPRENGFGDFCFDSALSRNRCQALARTIRVEWQNRLLQYYGRQSEQEYSTKYTELETSSVDHFRFLDLPNLIRERIYMWIGLNPTFDESQPLELRIQRFEPSITQECPNFLHSLNLHPARSSNYLVTPILSNHLSTTEIRKRPTASQRLQQETSIKTIRILSNVSCGLRHELGQYIWRNVHLICDDFAHDQLAWFLRERPSIWKGIKFLTFTVSLDGDPHDHLAVYRFREFCRVISEKLLLKRLLIGLWIREEDLEGFPDLEGGFKFLMSLLNLRVTEGFEVGGFVNVPDSQQFKLKVAALNLTVDTYVRIWFSKIQEALLPLTLRMSGSEMKRYLQKRRRVLTNT